MEEEVYGQQGGIRAGGPIWEKALGENTARGRGSRVEGDPGARGEGGDVVIVLVFIFCVGLLTARWLESLVESGGWERTVHFMQFSVPPSLEGLRIQSSYSQTHISY